MQLQFEAVIAQMACPIQPVRKRAEMVTRELGRDAGAAWMVASTLAADGVARSPYLVSKVEGPDGRVIFDTKPQETQAVSPQTAAEKRRSGASTT